jgi:hypothetical protein
LVLVAFALRVYRLGAKNIWWDEGLAIWAVRKPLVDTTLWTAADVHPPLYFWLLWGWIRLVGQTEFAARALTVGFGVLTAALAYAVGCRVGGRHAGRVAGTVALLFVAAARFEVWWSMELRMYALAGLGVVAAVYAVLRWLTGVIGGRPEATSGLLAGADGRPEATSGLLAGADGHAEVTSSLPHGTEPRSRRRWLALYVLAATAALYTVYLTGAALVALNVAVLGIFLLRRMSGVRNTSGAAAEWIVAQVAVLLAVVPWLLVALPRMQSWSSIRGDAASPRFVIDLWATLVATGVSADLASVRGWTVVFWLAAFAVPAALLAVWRVRRVRELPPAPSAAPQPWYAGAAALILILFVLFPPVIVWAATQPRSVFYSPAVEARYLVPFAAPVYALAAWAIARVWRWSMPVGAVLLVGAFLPLLATTPGYYDARRLRDVYQTLSLAIWSQAEPGDAVVLLSGNRYPLFLYYYDQPWAQPAGAPVLEYPLDAPPDWTERPPVIPFPDRGTESVEAHDWQEGLEHIVGEHDRVWLVEAEAHLQDPDGRVEDWLNERLPLVLSEAYGPDALHLFAADGEAPEVTGLSLRFPGMEPWSPGVTDLQPFMGVPVSVLMPGDELRVTVFGEQGLGQGNVLARLEARASALPTDVSVWVGAAESPAPAEAVTGRAPTEAVIRRALTEAETRRAPSEAVTRRALIRIPVTERTPGGRHRVLLDLGGAPVSEDFASPMSLRAVSVTGAPPLLAELAPVNADFGLARLAAVGIEPRDLAPGEALVLDLYWQPDADSDWPETPPVVFVHLVGPPREGTGDPVWANGDGLPSSGDWLAPRGGGYAFDRHVLLVDGSVPEGVYRIELGLYDPESGERLPVQGEDADEASRSAQVGEVEVR